MGHPTIRGRERDRMGQPSIAYGAALTLLRDQGLPLGSQLGFQVVSASHSIGSTIDPMARDK
jgi:hypothetical protein